MTKKIHTVAVLGSRGGSGKSTLARLIALGASLEGVSSAVMSTDFTRESQQDDERRPFGIIDTIVRDSDGYIDQDGTIKNVVKKYNDMVQDPDNAGGLLVVDGAGISSGLYSKLTEHVNLTIVCGLADQESVRAISELWDQLSDPKQIVINGWNGSEAWQKDRQAYIERLPKKPAILVPQKSAFVHLLDDSWRNDSAVNRQARKLFLFLAPAIGVMKKDEAITRLNALPGSKE